MNRGKIVITGGGVGDITVESVVGIGASETNVEITRTTAGFGFENNGGKSATTSESARKGGTSQPKNTVSRIDDITKVVGVDTAVADGSDVDERRIVIDDDVGGIGGGTTGVENNIDTAGTALFETTGRGAEAESGGESATR